MSRKTILVTGAAGTVGTYAASLAEAAGYRVIASDVRGRAVSERDVPDESLAEYIDDWPQ